MESIEEKKEETVNLKTLYSDLNEIEQILDNSVNSLEYLVDGSASDKAKPESSSNATVTLSMLLSEISELRRLAAHNEALINRLTGK